MTADEFQKEIASSRAAQISSYSVPGSSVLGGFIQRSRSCVAQYNGRQIFEMLQNMDDQTTGDGLNDLDRRSQILLDKSNGRLLFRNMGVPFSVLGVRSIMYPDVSPKRIGKIPTIGNKGLGFRSLLNWNPEAIIIRSNGTELIFSDQVVSGFVEKDQRLKNSLAETNESNLPMLAFPEIKNWEENRDGWVTEIELKGVLPYVENIETELKNFDSELMLFLPHLREVEIVIVNNSGKLSKTIYRASKRGPILDEKYRIQKRIISKQEEDGGITSREWLVCWDRGVLRRDVGREEERVAYNIEIAVPKEAEQRRSLSRTLYNFLPVSGVRINLPCLIHATVNLGDNRNELLVGNWQNREIFTKKLPELMKHFAEVIKDAFDRGEYLVDDRWLPYNMLAAPTLSDDRNYVGPFYKILRNIADTEAYVPCVDGEFRRANECCYYVPDGNDGCDMLEFFNVHPEFIPSYVLKGVPNGPVQFYTRPMNSVSLTNLVNSALMDNSYHDEVLVDLAYILWRIAKRSGWRESGPYWIFHDSVGRRFGSETENVYTPMEGDALVFPAYMKADFIDEKLWVELLRRFDGVCANYADGASGNARRTFCNNELHKFLRVEYYDRAAAAKKIISSANEYLREDFAVDDKRQVVTQLLKALWENFRDDVEPHPRKENIPISVKDDGTLQFAGDFLFDDALPFYNGVLGSDVFLDEARLRELISEPDADMGRLKAFFRYLGVRADVRINYVTIGTAEGNSNPYLLFLQRQQSFGKDGGLPQSIANGNALEDALELPALRDVEIVKRIPLKNFFDLLLRESIDGLMKLLSDTVSLSWKTVNGRVFYPYTVQWSYMAFQLCDKFKNVIYGENDKTLAALGWQYEEARGGIPVDVIKKLGAKSRFSDLTQNELYDLLRSVADGNIQPTKDFYKKINAAFVELEKTGQKICPPGNLKVFASWKEGEKERFAFCPVGEVFYHDNPAHARQLVRDRRMFFLGARVGVDSVCRHFGVQKLDEHLAHVGAKTNVAEDLQSAFKNDLLQRNSALSVILSRNIAENLESCRGRIDGVDILLVSSLCYSYDNGPDQNLPVYGYIRDRNSGPFYLCVGQLHDLSQLDNTGLRRLSRSLAGIFCDAVRSANDELQHQFEVCFFDLETAKEDLRDLGYENDLDTVVDTANYYRKYQSEFKNLSDTLWTLFLKPTIWEYMNRMENKNLQKYYRTCELMYLDYVSRASEYNGELYRYCTKHQKDSLTDCALRDAFVEFLKRGQKHWMPSACEGLDFAWDRIELMPKDLPTFDVNYSDPQDADLLQGVDGEVSDEYLSLMSFPGNQDRLRELLKQGEKIDTDVNQNVTDTASPRSLTMKVGGVNLYSPRVDSMRVVHGGGGQAMGEKKQSAMKARGIEAERCVEAWLRNQPGNNHVEGRSGTSRTSGRNDSLHYDISYVNGGKTYYVEVKACDSGEFHISAGELEFARQNTETYRLALVYLESQQLQLIDDVYNRVKDVKVAEDWKVAVN